MPLVGFASPAVAANTPEVLVQELTQAAHNGDERGFLSNMSVETQRAMGDADAAGSKLTQAQKDLQAVLMKISAQVSWAGASSPELQTAKQCCPDW